MNLLYCFDKIIPDSRFELDVIMILENYPGIEPVIKPRKGLLKNLKQQLFLIIRIQIAPPLVDVGGDKIDSVI